MGAVAKGSVAGVLALAEERIPILLRCKWLRSKVGSFVGSITERLAAGMTTGAEEVFLSGFEVHFDGSFGGDMWF